MNLKALSNLSGDEKYAGSEARLRNCNIYIKDLKEFQNLGNFSYYLKLFNKNYLPNWGKYGYLDCNQTDPYQHGDDEFNKLNNKIDKDGKIIFNTSEKSFLQKFNENLGNFNLDCIYQIHGYRTYVFDGLYHAFINPKNNTRVVYEGSLGLEREVPKTIDSLDLSKKKSFEIPAYINAVDPDNAEWGFYACYRDLSLLNYFHDIHPYDHRLSNYKSKDEFLNELKDNLSKYFDGKEIKYLLIHHCHSLAMLLTARSSMWDIYQYIHVVAYTEERCISVMLTLWD